ncbi:glycoside hydrolase family 79 protein, partial [Amniculicola lignicola CBS 123094]
IDGSWQSFSIEFSYMADYFGNLTTPNTLSHNLLANLYNRSGKNAIIRAGGSTANIAIYNASQPFAVENFWNGSTNVGLSGANTDQPSLTNLGPAWFEAFKTAPNGTLYVYDLNFRDNSTEGVKATAEVAKLVYDNLGTDLYAFELGNEMERWGGRYRADDWSPTTYVENYLMYADLFEQSVFPNASVQPFFQMGTLQGSGNETTNQPWNSKVIMALGLNRKGQIKAASQHDYHGSNCKSTKQISTLRQNLLNHTNAMIRATPHIEMSPIIDAYGVEYTIGETNSISCQGRDGVSNVFGSALWYLNYNLYIASSTMVNKMYFHMGTPYRYSLWSPFASESNNHSAIIRPSYYGAVALAEAIGGNGGQKQVHAVLQEETMVAYSLYAAEKLDGLFIINMEPWNSTETGDRPFTQFKLPARINKTAVVKRLTSPGSDVKTGGTWAGKVVTEEGLLEGQEVLEKWAPGEWINVGYAEAVLLK